MAVARRAASGRSARPGANLVRRMDPSDRGVIRSPIFTPVRPDWGEIRIFCYGIEFGARAKDSPHSRANRRSCRSAISHGEGGGSTHIIIWLFGRDTALHGSLPLDGTRLPISNTRFACVWGGSREWKA